MRSPVVTTRISPEAHEKLQEMMQKFPGLTVRQLVEKAIEAAHKKLVKTE